MSKSTVCAVAFLLGPLLLACADARPRPDLLVADFEGKDYGGWKTTGTAFGAGPAQGTLPRQMPVSGFLGRGLVNSYHGGDASTGTLTSPGFTIERPFLNFLVGGGKYPGQTCVNLLVAGQVVRSATGPNDRPGGSERLDWHTWDVKEFAGKEARIAIVDRHTGGWGHINVDHIVQSDRKRQAAPAQRELTITKRYLHLPVATGAPKRKMRYVVEGATVRAFEIELADAAPSLQVFDDVSAYRGRALRIEVDALPADSKGLAAIVQSDALPEAATLYKEKDRPQFHFTSRRGWLNDPNGLVWSRGEYHLFYQHNPYGWPWGNMHWGHAVSKDLVHWTEVPIALYPRRFGDWCFSGSAVVDANNTSGLKKGSEDLLVAAYTSTGRGECIVYSNDRGRTWTEIPENPVLKHAGRDPRLLWHAPSKRWVMAVYDETGGKRSIAFHTSPDLRKWTYQSRIADFFECPDLIELPIEGKAGATKWVLYAADGKYLLGRFDGARFTPESERQTLWHGNFYAAQTWSDAPGGRRIQIGWAQGIDFPGMPFNQQMTVPCQLTLRPTTEGVRLYAEPIKELAQLRGKAWQWSDRALASNEVFSTGTDAELFDVHADFEVGAAAAVGLLVRGIEIVHDAKKQTLHCAGRTVPLRAENGRVRLRVLLDRRSVEVFGNGGRVALSVGVRPAAARRSVEAFARGGAARLRALDVAALRSAW